MTPSTPATILVADDSAVNRLMLETFLSGAGFRVVMASGGLEALDLLATERPDLVLLDVMMPDLDGYGVLEKLRSGPEPRRMSVLMVTSLTDSEDKVRALEAGADDYVTKPFSKVELLARVRSHLRIRELVSQLEHKTALLHRMVDQYVSQRVAAQILEDADSRLQLGGFTCRMSVLMSDIRGFTSFSESADPDVVVRTLNRVYGVLAPLVVQNNGALDKLMGDCLMARFGTPTPSPEDPDDAVRAGARMMLAYDELRAGTPALTSLGLGIGIASGEAIVGNIGSQQLMDYTAIGVVPNRAARLQDAAGEGEILVDQATVDAMGSEPRGRPREIKLKGFSSPVVAWSLDPAFHAA